MPENQSTPPPSLSNNADSAPPSHPDRERLRGLTHLCRNALKSSNRTLEKQQAECDEAAQAQQYSQWADTLLANQGELKRGMQSCILDNVHTGETIEIRLNPKLDARENADLLYRKARKGRRGLESALDFAQKTTRQIEQLETQLARIKELVAQSQEAAVPDEQIDTVQEQLAGLGVGTAATRNAQTYFNKQETVPYRRYTLEGWEIYAGKTSTQNDELTTRFAKPQDVWLHVGQHAGSHVIIRRAKNAPWPPDTVVAAAGAIAAWFSKARYSSFAEVHITEKRFVYKRRKSPAGEVVLEQFKTLRVAPCSPQQLFKGLLSEDGQ